MQKEDSWKRRGFSHTEKTYTSCWERRRQAWKIEASEGCRRGCEGSSAYEGAGWRARKRNSSERRRREYRRRKGAVEKSVVDEEESIMPEAISRRWRPGRAISVQRSSFSECITEVKLFDSAKSSVTNLMKAAGVLVKTSAYRYRLTSISCQALDLEDSASDLKARKRKTASAAKPPCRCRANISATAQTQRRAKHKLPRQRRIKQNSKTHDRQQNRAKKISGRVMATRQKKMEGRAPGEAQTWRAWNWLWAAVRRLENQAGVILFASSGYEHYGALAQHKMWKKLGRINVRQQQITEKKPRRKRHAKKKEEQW